MNDLFFWLLAFALAIYFIKIIYEVKREGEKFDNFIEQNELHRELHFINLSLQLADKEYIDEFKETSLRYSVTQQCTAWIQRGRIEKARTLMRDRRKAIKEQLKHLQ